MTMNPPRARLSFRHFAGLAAIWFLLSGAVLQAEPEAPIVGQIAPAWKLKDLDDKEVSSEQFKGKVVVLDFWATWCQPCVAEIPGYAALQKKYGADGLVVVGVLYRDPKTAAYVKKFAAEKGLNYTVVVGDDAIADAFGGLEALPTTFLISRAGRIVHQKVGAVPHEEYEKLVVQALR
jgi:peroxiredoxin